MKTNMKVIAGLLCLLLLSNPVQATATAAPPILGLISGAVKKVIKAIDLRIQRLQNKTIWLQNAQKKIENVLSKLKLSQIANWTQQQHDLYKNYYEELTKVKSIISDYQRIREISQKQARLVSEYERVWSLLQRDNHFSQAELEYMQQVYSGILEESMKNIDQIVLILDSFTTQMSDARRLSIINTAADQIDSNYDDLTLFNRQHILLSLQRAKTQQDIQAVKKFYAIPN